MNPYLAALVVVVNAAIFVHFDAARLRDSRHIGPGPKGTPPHAWAALAFLFLPLAVPYYLYVRSTASAAALREGPPPAYTARDLNVWGYVGSVVFLAAACYLGFIGRFAWAALAGLAMAVSLFGGRKAEQVEAPRRDFGLGDAGWDMSGFRPVDDEDSEDDEDFVASGVGAFIPPVAGRGGSVQPGVSASGGDSGSGIDIFSPPTRAEAETDLPAPGSRAVPPARPSVADALPPLSLSVSEDDDEDVWDPLRADEEAQRAREQKAASQAAAPTAPPESAPPPPPSNPLPSPAIDGAPSEPQESAPAPSHSPSLSLGEELPPGLVDDDEPSLLDDDLAPFELAPDEDDDELVPFGSDQDEGDDDLERLAPLPPLATGGSRPAPRPGAPGSAHRPAPPQRSQEAVSQRPAAARPATPPRPSSSPAASGPRAGKPRGPAAAGSPTSPPPGGFVGQASSSGPPAVLIWFAVIGVILAGAWWLGSRGDDVPPATEEIVAEPVEGTTTVAEEPPASVERAEAAEEAMRRKMNRWISTYDTVMRPIAELVEEIDFGELGQGACLELQRQAEKANVKLKEAPDEEVEILLRPAFRSFVEAGRACSGRDEMQWSVHLLQAKDHTHETQILLDERYRYVGPFELEQEEALGHSRSVATISGRYLVGELEAQQNSENF